MGAEPGWDARTSKGAQGDGVRLPYCNAFLADTSARNSASVFARALGDLSNLERAVSRVLLTPPSNPPWQEWQGSAFARVRSRSLAWTGTTANRRFARTGANGRERSRTLAMQKVVGSNPIIRSTNPLETAGFCFQIGDIVSRMCPQSWRKPFLRQSGARSRANELEPSGWTAADRTTTVLRSTYRQGSCLWRTSSSVS
jgi:hypothetical protein